MGTAVKKSYEPMLNIPPVVTKLLALLAGIHAIRWLFLTPQRDIDFLLLFAFIPARYGSDPAVQEILPGGIAADAWTFVTYALVHGDIVHLTINAIWLLAFGSAVARRFGSSRFLAFFAVTAIAGALAHLVTHDTEFVPMVGASAAISGYMAAATRFVFQEGGPLGLLRAQDSQRYRVRAIPLLAALTDSRILAFLAAWFALNILLGLGSLSLGSEREVAWQAHIGGFLAGLILFAWFDPVTAAGSDDSGSPPGRAVE